MAKARVAGERVSALALVTGVTVATAVVSAVVFALPGGEPAYRAPALHAVLETINAVVALLVGYLVYGRYRQSRRLQELLLMLALGTVAAANLALTALPSAVPVLQLDEATRWASLGVRFLGTVLLFVAATTPASRTVTVGRSRLMAGGVAALVLVGGAAVTLLRDALPNTVDPLASGADSAAPGLVAHPVVVAVQVLGIVLYGVAAWRFASQADRTGDQLLRWVAAGCVLASFARVHYLLYPSLYSDFVYTGDLLRLGFYSLMLVGAAREITAYWRVKAQAAVLEDRRRLARDLHDGLIQELSYIYAQSRRLESNPGDPVLVERITSAAGRAIDESRRALAAVTQVSDEPFADVLHHAAEEMAGRYDVKILVAADRSTQVDVPIAEALLRITGEAVRNAVRHGAATQIDIALTAQPLSLRVTDDGTGFPAHQPGGGRVGGFGLTSMRERAAGIGANLTIQSAAGEGTTVQVAWT